MKRLRVYVDTSVIGGSFDPEFATWSNGLVADFRAAVFGAVNLELGYRMLCIHSPREITTYGRPGDDSSD